jgi:cathepsin L
MDQNCAFDPSKIGANASAFVVLTPGDENILKEAVANVGPISVAIEANDNFSNYAGGVYDDPECHSDIDVINHAVLIVGYGTDSDTGKDYWLVKNSWNTSWGEEGYIKMVRNKKNQCAIATLASYMTVKPMLK